MKKGTLLACVLLALTSINSYAEEKSSIVDRVSTVISEVVQDGKDVIKGVKEGIDTGRTEGTSIDDAIIVRDKKYQEYVDIVIFSIQKTNVGLYEIDLGFKNKTDKIIRLVNLNEKKNLQLLDADSFVTYANYMENDITVPKSAAIKYTLKFRAYGLVSEPAILRLYETDIKLK
ncbi:Uncharacterised protein [Pasteurella multocida]|nr:hypothetical protein [Pasteurella dagmatis]SNV71970.1 Uncharacterised protein [Pasteurella dagmatis]VEI58244.1 Uncharacterised protein [Pasteurella multocida]